MASSDLDTRSDALSPIVEVLRARQDELVDLGVQRIFNEIAAYGRASDPAFVADVRKHVNIHHSHLVECVAEERRPVAEELAFIRPNATRRVGRVPLADFLQAFRLYMEVFWEAVVECATDEASRDAALGAAFVVIRYINTAAALAGEVYAEAEQLLKAQGERVRRDLLEDLLAGGLAEPGPRLTAAIEAGLHPPVDCVVVVAVPLTPPEDAYVLRAVAIALARAVGSVVQPLVVTRHDALVMIARVEREVSELVSCLRRAQEQLAAEGTRLAVGMSSVQRGLDRTPTGYAEARAAAERVRGEGGLVALPGLSVFDCLTLFGRETANARIPDRIRQFVAEDHAEGGLLTMTLLAYVAADFNARAAAERLFVHPNTARYRLGKIEERTGADMRRVADVVDLLIAVRVVEGELERRAAAVA